MSIGISIAIPTYNRARLLGPTLESVRNLQVPENTTLEIIVIDNNCTDETPQVVKLAAATSPVPLRHVVESRQGLCFGRNRALEEARYEHVVYLDDDIEIARRWLYGYIKALERFDADCVVGPVTPRFEAPVPRYFTPRVIQSLTSFYSLKGTEPKLLPADVAHEVPGCNFGVKKSVAAELGGFDQTLDRIGAGLLAGGDTEFGLRLVAGSKRIAYHPECAITHVITAEKLTPTYIRRRWRGLGATRRALERRVGKPPLSYARNVRYAAGVITLGSKALWLYGISKQPRAFQRELEARRGLGYLLGR